jgi:hypothetical protein
VNVAFTEEDELRFCGAKNAGLRLELFSNTEGNGAAALDSIAQLKDGSIEGIFGKHGNLHFTALHGSVTYRGEFDPQRGQYACLEIDFLPDDDGKFEISMQSYLGTAMPKISAKSFEQIRAENLKSYADFFANYKEIPEKYKEMAKESIYVTWSHVMKPKGL